MARHRNIRSMNYSDEYEGYDDVYGHSVEDDSFCMSPSDAAFIYDREGTRSQQHIGQFFKDISEEEESEQNYDLSEEDKVKLESCVKQLEDTLKNTVSRKEMIQALLDNNFNLDKALNILLDKVAITPVKIVDKKEKDDNFKLPKPTKDFAIPKLSKFNTKLITDFKKPSPSKSFFTKSPLIPSVGNKLETESKSFTSLADLTNSHLEKVNSLSASNLRTRQIENINVISKNLSDLSLSQKSDDQSHDSQMEKVVDLSIAVKSSSSSVRSKSLSKSIEDFEMPYIECDSCEPILDPSRCIMDISSTVDKSYTIGKRASTFGKILCKRYLKRSPMIAKDVIYNKNIKLFIFDTPSPDDNISKFLKR